MGVPRPTGGKKSHSHRPGAGGRKLSAPSSGQEGFLKGVTRNAILNEVVRNKQALQKENERLGKAKKKKTRTQVLAAMDLQELQMERIAMARMGFPDKVEEIDRAIEAERERIKHEREEKENQILNQKLAGLQMSQRRRVMTLEQRLTGEMETLRDRCERDRQALRDRHEQQYRLLMEETATRATGGVSSCICQKEYLCRHPKSASYNTRKPDRDVIRLRQNADRLRITGRDDEADEMESKAAIAEERAEQQWRTKVGHLVVKGTWAGGKSRLEQMIERQRKALNSLEEVHTEKIALLEKTHALARRNLRFTLEAERKKVVLYCRRAALQRMTRNVKEDHENHQRIMAHKSDGMQNVSKNMIRDSDDSSDGSLDAAALDWSAPKQAGLDNSDAIMAFDKIQTGEAYKPSTPGVESAENQDEIKTTGSRYMDTWKMESTHASAVYDPTKRGATDGIVNHDGLRLRRLSDGRIVNLEDSAAVGDAAVAKTSAWHLKQQEQQKQQKVEIKTTGSRFMDTWKMQSTNASAVYDPTKRAAEGGDIATTGLRLRKLSDGRIVNMEDAAAVGDAAVAKKSAWHLQQQQQQQQQQAPRPMGNRSPIKEESDEENSEEEDEDESGEESGDY